VRIDASVFTFDRLLAVAVVLSFAIPLALLVPQILIGVYLLLFWWLPSSVGVGIYLYAPFVLFLLWLATLVLATIMQGLHGLWLLVTALVAVPAIYLHWVLVLNCAFYGRCV